MDLTAWLSENWFVLLQSVGIVGSLWYAGLAFRFDARVRKIGNLLDITKQHRELWEKLYERPELERVRQRNVNLGREPVTVDEALFVNLLILHLGSTYRAIKEGVLIPPERLGRDVREFFSLPIPKAVWREQRGFQDDDFVEFVEEHLKHPKD